MRRSTLPRVERSALRAAQRKDQNDSLIRDAPRTSDHECLLVRQTGAPKTGKSLGAGSAPGPILYLNSDLAGATRLVHKFFGDRIQELSFEGLPTLVEVSTEITKSPQDWGTVVLDTIGDAHRKVIEGLSGRAMRPKINDYGDTTTHLERFCRFMCEAPVNFVIVSHETISKDEEAGTHERLPWTGTSNPALGSKLMGMVDIIGYTGIRQSEDPDGKPLYVAQLVSAGGRRGGDRYNCLGAWRELDLSGWLEVIRKSEEEFAGQGAKNEKFTSLEVEVEPVAA